MKDDFPSTDFFFRLTLPCQLVRFVFVDPPVIGLVVADSVLRLDPELVLQEAELQALEAGGGGEIVTEVHEVQRSHGLQYQNLVNVV